MMELYWLVYVVCVQLLTLSRGRGVFGFSSGPPDTACDSMAPAHAGSSVQSGTPMYQITLQHPTYTPNGDIDITLSSTSAATFKGYMIQVHDGVGNRMGSFTGGGGKSTCTNTARTHNEASDKITSTVTWTAPATSVGQLSVAVTVVQDRVTYWVARELVNITEGPTMTTPTAVSGQTPASTATTTTQPQGTLVYDTACGLTQGCFHDCSTESCSYIVAWSQQNDAIKFRMRSVQPIGRYIAIGFSSDNNMGSDSVIECFAGGTDVYNSYNEGRSNTRLTGGDEQAGISDITTSYDNGVLDCHFTRQKTVTNSNKIFDLNSQWTLIYAHGAVYGGYISQHDETPITSDGTIDFLSTQDVSGSPDTLGPKLVKAHGCLMVFAWMGAATIGIVCATWFKMVWPDTKVAGLHVWFQIHRGAMVFVFITTITAFIIIFTKNDWELIDMTSGSIIRAYHPLFGILATCLCIINPFVSLLRCGPKDPKRWIFNLSHWLVGLAAHGFAITAMFGGVHLGPLAIPSSATDVMVVFTVWYAFIMLLLQIILLQRNNIGSSSSGDISGKDASDSLNSTVRLIMTGLFAVHVLVVVILSTTLVAIIAKS